MFGRLVTAAAAVCGVSAGAVNYQWMRCADSEGTPATVYNLTGKTNEPSVVRAPLHSAGVEADVCVIGGGFAGLHTALSLAERGKKVVLLEGARIGAGASGRNGGDAVNGFHTPAAELARWCGPTTARELWRQGTAGYDRLKGLIATYKIRCDAEEAGAVTVSFAGARKEPTEQALREEVEETNRLYDQKLQFLTRADLEARGFHSLRYSHGVLEPRNLTLNPLELCLGLARVCEAKGVRIHEASHVRTVTRNSEGRHVVQTSMGSVVAKDCVLCTARASVRISPHLAMRTASLSTSMMVTEPLPKDALDACLKAPFAIFDDRFGLAYFRRVGDRIVYGCFASGLPTFATKPATAQALTEDLSATFPTLRPHVKAARCWSGRLHSTLPVFPLVGRDRNGMYYSIGFGGHGLVPTCAAGEVVAEAIVSGNQSALAAWSEPLCPWLLTGGPWGTVGSVVFCAFNRWNDTLAGRK
jgi:gamma-glutamylputrescine oxidase